MKRHALLMVLCGLALLAADAPDRARWTFEDAKLGEIAPGWTAAKTGQGAGSVWKILEDASAPAGKQALAQTSSEGPNSLFNVCAAEKPKLTDVDLSVALKPVSGKIDQGGGPVWRFQNADNYYIARFNPLEDNFRLYKVIEGKRQQLATADVEAPAGKWHTIRIVHRGERIQCSLNGKLLLEATDGAIKQAGKVDRKSVV